MHLQGCPSDTTHTHTQPWATTAIVIGSLCLCLPATPYLLVNLCLSPSPDLLSQTVRGKFTHQQKIYQLWAGKRYRDVGGGFYSLQLLPCVVEYQLVGGVGVNLVLWPQAILLYYADHQIHLPNHL